jgi:hypothetical protein
VADNHRAITLNCIPGKVFCRILLSRIQGQIEAFTSDNQYGFRPGRGTIDAIFVIRQVLEKAREHNVPMHFNFIDFKAAFDTVWREALWKMLGTVGVSKKIVNIIRSLYRNTECAVMVDGSTSEWFGVGVGVRQGCLLSPTLFNVFLEFVMRELETLDRTLTYSVDMAMDIRYADDTTLLPSIFDKLEMATEELENACRKWGMRINAAKCRVLSSEGRQLNIDGAPVETVESFVFLGSLVPGTTDDVKRRIALASSSFGRLRQTVWNRGDVSRRLKMRLFQALIVPIAIYGAESWTLSVEDNGRLEVFEMRCLRAILGVTLRDRIRNEDIRQQLGVKSTITEVIRERRLKWFGHVMRRPEDSILGVSYRRDFTAPRPRGRPPKRWKDQIFLDTGRPLRACEEAAQEREDWREVAAGRRRARGPYGLRP